VLFDVGSASKFGTMEIDIDYNAEVTEDSFRKIKYIFDESILKLPLVSTS